MFYGWYLLELNSIFFHEKSEEEIVLLRKTSSIYYYFLYLCLPFVGLITSDPVSLKT